jgi:hypothetical protein
MLLHIPEGLLDNPEDAKGDLGVNAVSYIFVREIDLDALLFCELVTQRAESKNKTQGLKRRGVQTMR